MNVLDPYLDVIRCPYCGSADLTRRLFPCVNGSRSLQCDACEKVFRVSAKKWTKYERRTEESGVLLARETAAKCPGRLRDQMQAVEWLGEWLRRAGLPRGEWDGIRDAAFRELEGMATVTRSNRL